MSKTEEKKPVKPNLEMLKTVWAGVQDQVKFADSKAGFVAAFHALLFGFMITHADKLVKVVPADRNVAFYVSTILCVLYGTLTVLAVFLLISAVISRFGELAPQSKSFFGHITRQHGKDYTKYCRAVSEMSDEDWCEDISGQIVEVSHIAATKHRLVRTAAQATAMAFLLWCATLIAMLWIV
jgi:hypothetical protein